MSEQVLTTPRREAWKRLVGGMLFRVVILLLILYTVYHCVVAAAPRMTTAVVKEGQESVFTEGTATIFRDETVLRVAGQGALLSYPLENGAKVNANSTLVNLYTTALDTVDLASWQEQLSRVEDAIVALRRAERKYSYAAGAMGSASLGSVHKDVRSKLLYLAQNGTTSSFDLAAARAELMISLDAYAALAGTDTSAVTPTEALESQRAALISAVSRSARVITLSDLLSSSMTEEGMTTFSGYFYHADTVDGYETVCLRDALATMDIMDYDAMQATQRMDPTAGGTLLGKIVNDYQWSITLPVAYDVADRLELGKTYPVSFPEENNTEIDMRLDRIIRSVGDGRAVLVLSADTMPAGFRFTRHQTARLMIYTEKGYRIPDTAVQSVNGRECVYVLTDGSVRLREIEILVRGEGYVLVAIPGKDFENGLSRNDVIITSGEDLYDGKYIN